MEYNEATSSSNKLYHIDGANLPSYRLNGHLIGTRSKGIVIEKGKKVIKNLH